MENETAIAELPWCRLHLSHTHHYPLAASVRSPDAHLYDRMVAAGIPPAYPRPAPPSKGRAIVSVATAAATFVLLSALFLITLAM